MTTSTAVATLTVNRTPVYAAGNYLFPQAMAETIGLDWEGQKQRIERSAWSKGRTCVMQVQLPGDSQSRPRFAMHHTIVPMWVAGIDASRVNPDVKPAVEAWQCEIAEVLAEHYYSTSTIEAEPEKGSLAWYARASQEVGATHFFANGNIRYIDPERMLTAASEINAAREALNETYGAIRRQCTETALMETENKERMRKWHNDTAQAAFKANFPNAALPATSALPAPLRTGFENSDIDPDPGTWPFG
jgi:hypothetical protein